MRPYSPVVIALSGLTALALPMGIGRFAFTPILPMMQDDAGLSIAAGAWLASANYFGTLLGALLAMVTKVAIPMAIRSGLVIIGVTTLGMGLETKFRSGLSSDYSQDSPRDGCCHLRQHGRSTGWCLFGDHF